MKKLSKAFYNRKSTVVAKALLGKILVHKTTKGITSGMIVETEAYMGSIDKASHAYQNRSPRTEVMFGAGGYAYVYLIYGMYCCFNVVAGKKGQGDAVLIRAIEPIEGLEIMRTRRGKKVKDKNLTNGPGKLCQALDISREHYGADLAGEELYIAEYKHITSKDIGISKRINIAYAEEAVDFPWRFYVKDNIFVSKAK